MSLTSKIKSYLQSPQGRRLIDRGQREIAKPENQRRIQRLLSRNRGR